jgi:hypothetical protein
MAVIYGYCRSDIDLLNKCPEYINKQNDSYTTDKIDQSYLRYTMDIDSEKKGFLENISYEIETLEKQILEDEKKLSENLEKIDLDLAEIAEQETKLQKIVGFINKIYITKKEKPTLLKKSKKLQNTLEKQLLDLKNNPDLVFLERQKDLVLKIQTLEKLKEDSLYKKAKQETKVLDQLLKLKDDSHVLCGVNIAITKFKKIKAREIRFDFIIINNKGVFLIKINKDDQDSKKKYLKFEDLKKSFEMFLKNMLLAKDVSITESRIKALFIEQGIDSHDYEKSSVKNVSLEKLNFEIDSYPNCLYEKEVSNIVYFLRNYIKKK